MSEIAAIITSVVGALAAAGSAVAWLWNKVEKRFAEVEAELKKCQARERTASEREAKHLTVIELLWQEVERRSRGSPNAVLGRARKLLDELKKDPNDD